MTDFEPLKIAHLTVPTSALQAGPAPLLDWIAINRLVIDRTYQRSVSRAGSANIARIDARSKDQRKTRRLEPAPAAHRPDDAKALSR